MHRRLPALYRGRGGMAHRLTPDGIRQLADEAWREGRKELSTDLHNAARREAARYAKGE